MKLEIKTNNDHETMLVAEKFAQTINPPLVISLVGDLGAGKTTFTKGFAKGFGIEENITSPTFAILNEYNSKRGEFFHFDLYRLHDLEEAYAMGFEEYFDLTKLRGVVLVEWAENAKGILPMRHVEVKIDKLNENQRKITLDAKGEVAKK